MKKSLLLGRTAWSGRCGVCLCLRAEQPTVLCFCIKSVQKKQVHYNSNGVALTLIFGCGPRAFTGNNQLALVKRLNNPPIHIIFKDSSIMNFASNYAYIASKPKLEHQKPMGSLGAMMSDSDEQDLNLNVFVLTFEGVKTAEKQLSGGDPYNCKKCKAILNHHSKVLWQQDLQKQKIQQKVQLAKGEALWDCEFCSFKNLLKIQREEKPAKDDVVYMLESENMDKSQADSTLVFCIDTSGSMNSTSVIEGKVELKYGISQEEIQMLRQFMQPGDQAQLNYLPGLQNQNKTFVSRKQCILSAVESQINEIRKIDPFKKIGFVTFGSQVVALGDTKNQTLHLVGDKLNNKESIIGSLAHFRLTDTIAEAYATLLNNINKTQAKGQTALGPALITALEIAAKGSPGSSVMLCTDGLANVGVGQLQPFDQQKIKFYSQLGERAKANNITVNIVTLKGEGCKIQAIGKLAQITNGNIKIVNPQKLSDDFANVLKDQVVGLNVVIRVLLHKGMHFRNEQAGNLKEEGCILERLLANATKNTRISFEYDVKKDEQLKSHNIDLKNLKQIPFQAQIQYTSPTGGKFLRVVSSVCKTTESKAEMSKEANLGVVHQRVTNQTTLLYKGGDFKASQQFNNRWANYLSKNFHQEKYQDRQLKFAEKNDRLKKAIRHRHRKSIQKKVINQKEELSQSQLQILHHHSDIESDEDQKELVQNMMERQCYSIAKSNRSSSEEKPANESKKEEIKKEKVERKRSVQKKEAVKRERRRSIPRKSSYCSDSD